VPQSNRLAASAASSTSAAILIGAEVFGAAFAGSWAIAQSVRAS
jgi:hypothetical protein